MGKGGRCPETRTGRYARCETSNPSWGSSARGGTLESWVLRKAHARFGEGRMEKCSRSNSPAAYSTSITAATRGTASSTSPGSSCPSASGTGPMHEDQRGLVLEGFFSDTAGYGGLGFDPAQPLGPQAEKIVDIIAARLVDDRQGA